MRVQGEIALLHEVRLKGKRLMTEWHLYMIRCRGGALYTGIATDIARRLDEHETDTRRGARYLRGKGPLELVLQRAIGRRGLAQRIESRIKRLSKVRKEQLVLHDDLFEALLTWAAGLD